MFHVHVLSFPPPLLTQVLKCHKCWSMVPTFTLICKIQISNFLAILICLFVCLHVILLLGSFACFLFSFVCLLFSLLIIFLVFFSLCLLIQLLNCKLFVNVYLLNFFIYKFDFILFLILFVLLQICMFFITFIVCSHLSIIFVAHRFIYFFHYLIFVISYFACCKFHISNFLLIF